MKPLKITVIGGGSSYTPELVEGILKRYDELPVKTLYLLDIEEGREKLDIVVNLAKRMVKREKRNIDVVATLNRIEAIRDADFILTQIRVGGLKSRAKDEQIPLAHGAIGQETTGAGGFSKALRTIPVVLDICKDIEKYAENAWLINFTNPAGLVTEAVQKHSKVKVLGLCNVPINMRHNLAEILEVDSSRVKLDIIGLNHLIWGTEVYLDGIACKEVVIDRLCSGVSVNMKNIPDLKWDATFLRALNMIPCPYHRYYYMKSEMLANELEHRDRTRAVEVMAIERELFKTYADETLDVKPPALEKRGGAYYSDAAIALISAIYNDKQEEHVVNVANQGTIPSLAKEAVIEVNCVVGKEGARPTYNSEVSSEIHGWIHSVKAYEQLTIEAAVNRDYGKALNALYVHPLINSVTQAKAILDELIVAHREYLEGFNKL